MAYFTVRQQQKHKRIDLTGMKFGRLSVMEITDLRAGNYSVCWRCRCDCGTVLVVASTRLMLGRSRSCGCLRRDTITTHGATKGRSETTEYTIWRGIKQRCLNKHSAAYADYGGRGITICNRWMRFENFLEDMGPRPGGCSIERIENALGYSPENCRWQKSELQSQNRRGNRVIAFDGIALCVAEWSRRTGIPSTAIIGRLKRGWTASDTLTIPVRD